MKNDYSFGAVYSIEPDYTDVEILKDLSNMKELNFRLVTLWPVANPWLDERSTGYVFSQTRKVLDICEKLGLKAILPLFGRNQSLECMSDSLLTPDMMIRDEEGERITYNGFWANLNHPAVRDSIDHYFREAITGLRDHPAVYGWNVFSEAHFRSDDPYTVRLYQEYLRKKYGKIENLNREWFRRYESFDQITPEMRGSAYSVGSSLLPEIEYERFRSENLSDICTFLYETAKRYDHEHPVIIDGTSAQIIRPSVTARNCDESAVAAIPDIYGSTFCPKGGEYDYRESPWRLAMRFTLPASAARKAGKPYFVSALQAHTRSAFTPGSEVRPEELGHWALMCYFTGADAMQLERWRPFLHGCRSTGCGLTRTDGTPGRRGEIIGRVLKQINALRGQYTDARPPEPVVRIGVSYRSRLFFDAFHKWRENNGSEAVTGWYRAFWSMGLPVGFADMEKLGDRELSTPVMVLPSLISVGGGTAEWLEEYVGKGGLLIADARLGTVNEWGVVPTEGIPGKRLSELFGVTETDVASGGAFLLDGESVPANFQYQLLETGPDATAVSAMEDGSPAVVVNSHGKGKTIYFNSFIGVEMAGGVPAPVDAFLREELTARVSDALLVEKDDRVHVAFLKSDAKTVMLAVNFGSDMQTVTLCNRKSDTDITNLTTGDILSDDQTAQLEIPADQSFLFAWED